MEKRFSLLLVLLLIGAISCQSCDSQICSCQSGQCTSCVSNFFFMQGPQCLLCDYRCKSCSADRNCSVLATCAKSYFYNNNTLLCDACPSRCDVCTNSSSCLQCSVGYALSAGSCVACQAANSLACDTPTTVSQCIDSYWKNGDTCLPCRQNCQQCSGPTSCSQCSPGYLKQVAAGTYCAPCISGCLSCSTNYTCDVCHLNFNLVGGSCVNISDACTKAIPNCLACSTTGGLICAVCQPLYYYLNGGCVYGASLLCQGGAVGPQPYKCSYSCQSNTYRQLTSNSNTTFSCLPLYQISSGSIYQLYFYGPFSAWRFVPSTTLTACSEPIIYSTTQSMSLKLQLSPYYKVSVSAKMYPLYLLSYVPTSSDALTVSLSITDNATNSDSYNLTGLKLNSSCTPLYLNFSTRNINEQSIVLTLTGTINNNSSSFPYGSVGLTQLLLQVYRCSPDCRICANTNYCLECIQLFVSNNQCVDTCGGLFELYKPTGDPTNYTSKACVSTCPAGFYPNVSNTSFMCLPCVAPCLVCRSLQQCSTCQPPFFFYAQNFSCLTSCPNTYYAKDGACLQCNTPCRTCSNQSVCTSCSIGFFNGNSCVASCAKGTYQYQPNNTCVSCSSNCLTCSISSTNCLSCPAGLALLSTACVSSCPTSGYYLDNSTMVCTTCRSPCLNCLSSTTCLSCIIGYLQNTSCLSSCPSGLYPETSNNTCVVCTNNCATCLSTTICQSCVPAYYLYQSACVSSCPVTYFPTNNSNSSIGGVCSSCSLPCLSCLSSVLCISCQTGFLSQLQNYTCLTTCQDTYFGRATDQQCVKCSSPCLTCKSATTCLTCLPGTNTYLQNSQCVSTCDLGYYVQSTVCAPCQYPCTTCIKSASTCLSCSLPFLLRNQQCVSQCPSGQYASSNNTVCAACVGDCLTCASSTSCLSCIKVISGSGVQKYLLSNQCVTSCPNGTFADGITLSCRTCVFPCLTCSDSLSCLSCSIGFLNLLTFRCDFCPSSQYADSIKKQCLPCNGSITHCDTCTNSTWCTSCQNGSYLYSGKCVSAAQCNNITGYYLNSQQQACLQCIAPCLTCVSQVACTSCLTGFLISSNQTCSHSCPLYFFADSGSKTCLLCNSSVCRTCANTASTCLDCYNLTDLLRPSTNLFNILFNRTCITAASCPKEYYVEYALATPQCQPCNSPCRECSSALTCLSCWSGILQNGTCVANCANGSFSTVVSGVLGCQSCDSSCLTCLNASTFCLTCLSGKLIQAGTCVSQCSSTYYADPNTLSCLACRSPCVNCSSILTCTSCSQGMLLYFGQCVQICPDGSYPSSNTSQCISCPSICQKCRNDATVGVVCTTCSNGKFMISTLPGQCINTCPAEWYPDYATYQCYQCQVPCKSCQSATSCTTCIAGYLKYHNDCLQATQCPMGAYLWPNQPRCEDSCQAPYFADPPTRTCRAACTPNYLKTSNQTCVYSCPSDYYVDSTLSCSSCYDQQGIYLQLCNSLLKFQVETRSIFNRLFLRATFTQPYGNLNLSSLTVVTSQLIASRLLTQSTPLAFTVQATTHPTLTLELLPEGSITQTLIELRLSSYIITANNSVLQNLNSSYMLSQYDLYKQQNPSALDSLESLGKSICIIVTIGFLAALLFNLGCVLYRLIDCLQLLFLLLFCNVDFSPPLNHFLFGLRYLHFLYLPQIFANSEGVQSNLLRLSPDKFGSLLTDITFLGNTGPAFIVLFAFLGVLVLCKLADLWLNRKKGSVADAPQQPDPLQQKQQPQPAEKSFHLRLAALIIDRFRYNYTNDVVFVVYFYLAVFSMTQMLSFTVRNNYNYVSNFFSVVFVIGASAVPFLLYFLIRSFRQQLEHPAEVTSLKCFVHRLELELPLARYSIVIWYGRKLLLSLLIVVIMAYPNKESYPTYLLGLLTLFSFVIMVLTALYKPYQLKAQVVYHCVFEAVFLLILICLSVCNLGAQILSQKQKLAAGYAVIVLVFSLFCLGMAYLALMALREIYLLLGKRDLLQCFGKIQHHLDSTDSEASKKDALVVPAEGQSNVKLVVVPLDQANRPESQQITEEKVPSEVDSEFNPHLNQHGSAPHILIKCIKALDAEAVEIEPEDPPKQNVSKSSIQQDRRQDDEQSNEREEQCEGTAEPIRPFSLAEPNEIRDFESMEEAAEK